MICLITPKPQKSEKKIAVWIYFKVDQNCYQYWLKFHLWNFRNRAVSPSKKWKWSKKSKLIFLILTMKLISKVDFDPVFVLFDPTIPLYLSIRFDPSAFPRPHFEKWSKNLVKNCPKSGLKKVFAPVLFRLNSNRAEIFTNGLK